MNYSNWGPPGLGPSMLSHNSCYWIQSSSGQWRPGACTNITMGVVCKLPRGKRPGRHAAQPPPTPSKLAEAGPGATSLSAGDHSAGEGMNRQAWGRRDPPLG